MLTSGFRGFHDNHCSVCFTVLSLLSLIRFIAMMLLNSKQEYRLIVGLIFYPLGSTSIVVSMAGVAYASLTIIVQVKFLFGKGCLLKEFLDQELHPNEICNHFSEGDFYNNFLKFLRVTFSRIDFMVKMSSSFAALVSTYMAIVCASREDNVMAIFVWLFWGSVQHLFAFVSIRLLFWTCGLWYVRKRHLIYQVEQINHMLRNMSTVQNTNRILSVVLRNYVRLSIDIHDFNELSSKATFLLTLSMTIFNACLLFSYHRLRVTHPIFGYGLLVLWIMFSMTTASVLNAVAVMYEKSQELSKVIRNVLTIHSGEISSRNLKQLQIILENISDQRHCSLSLTNIDGQIYTKLLSTRYIFYSIRVIVLLRNFESLYN